MYSKSLKKKSFVSNRKLFNLLKIKKSECKFIKKKLVQKKIWKKNILEDWEFISSINETIPAYFLRPRGDGPFPTIIYCHAHGETYDKGRVELLKGRKSLLSDYGSFLSTKGFAVLCIEMPCFGSRQIPNESSRSKSLSWYGKTLFGQMISEQMAGVDFLVKNHFVKKNKIVSFGLSMGATHSFWLAAMDRRINSSIHMCSFSDLATLIQTGAHDFHGHYMTVPGLLNNYTTSQIAGLIAPRPQLICVGLKDVFTRSKSFSKAKKDLISIYKKYSAHKKLIFCIENKSGHRETIKMRRKISKFLDTYLCK